MSKVRFKKLCRIATIFVVCVFLLILVCECILRFHFGLCDAVLMREDEAYEYIAQPNQKRKRFGNNIVYNSYSMRNDELRPKSKRILCLGDSIINGGTLTDQAELANELLEKKLSVNLQQDVQVLNVSAGSWGPDNCVAWLRKHGDFNAEVIILVVSSHDVHDTMTHVPVVGRLKYYPSRQYSMALLELWDRYLFPKSTLFHQTKVDVDERFKREHHIEKTKVDFNPGFQELYDLLEKESIPFIIYLHATLKELNDGVYDEDGQAIIRFCHENNIDYVTDLEHGLSREHFRENDFIHYNAAGQKLMANLLYERLHLIILSAKGSRLE